jgi:predicted nucleic acid-binding Zn ribbon protein
MTCEVCGKPIQGRADKRFCSPRCKTRAWRQAQQPRRLHLVVEGSLAEEVELDLDEEERPQASLIGAILEASKHDWRAASWLLTHRWPERFGRV